MSNLTRTNWPLGWVPSNDAVNGNPNGLIRSDNLSPDKLGVTSLIDGHTLVGTTLTFASKFYTKVIDGAEYLWTAYGLPVQSIVRTLGVFAATPINPPGAGTFSGHAAFADALGFVITTAGNFRAKDPITGSAVPLGLVTPKQVNGFGPNGIVNNSQSITLPAPEFVLSGTGTPAAITTEILPDSVTYEGCVSLNTGNLDTTDIGTARPDRDFGEDIIEFHCVLSGNATQVVDTILVTFLLDGSPTDPGSWQNYYELFFQGDALQTGIDTGATFSKRRSEAFRWGTDAKKWWSRVIGVRYIITATDTITAEFGPITIKGGAGGLLGVYQYIQQDVKYNSGYTSHSPVSPLAYNTDDGSTSFNVSAGSVTLTPARSNTPGEISAHRFFRKSVSDLGLDPSTGEPINQSYLNTYYYVGEMAAGTGVFTDYLSDTEVIQLNTDGSFGPNLFLKTFRASDTLNGIIDDIFCIEGLHKDRMIFMGISYIFISEALDIDSIDSRFTLRPSGNPNEKNMWIRQITNDILILGTTKNLYEISGTFAELPDGTLDINIRPIGEAYPPLSIDVCKYEGGLFYIASDGLRVTTGSNSTNISPQLRDLFKFHSLVPMDQSKKIHGLPPASILSGVGVDYSIAAAHQKIYFQIPLQDQTRRLFIYDTLAKTYSMMVADPIALYGTQAGELLASFSDGWEANVNLPSTWILDTIPGSGYSGQKGLPFVLRTVFDANEQPRNRKDTFTLKLVLDTGGRDVNVQIQKDGIGVTPDDETSWISLGTTSANGQQTKYFELSQGSVTLGFRYALQITDVSGVFIFKLYEATIEYEPRPEQLNYLRILPTNMGTISRKRWSAFAFVIDTLGNDITFTPYLDNMAWGSSGTVNTGTKLTYIFFFSSEAVATDMGGILSGGVFEFYQLNLEETIAEKLPPPVTYLVIPSNNYGTPNRKRHTSYKWQMITRGGRVQYTPIVDQTEYQPTIYVTTTKQTCDYYFPEHAPQRFDDFPGGGDVIGIDIGGILQSIENPPIPFEFYGVIVPQKIEVLPDRLQYLRLPNTNFGVPSRKRVRTIPLILDTRGNLVRYTPIVDDALYPPSFHKTYSKTTIHHFFGQDVFGTDFGGILSLEGDGGSDGGGGVISDPLPGLFNIDVHVSDMVVIENHVKAELHLKPKSHNEAISLRDGVSFILSIVSSDTPLPPASIQISVQD